jgi:hypothetical protein
MILEKLIRHANYYITDVVMSLGCMILEKLIRHANYYITDVVMSLGCMILEKRFSNIIQPRLITTSVV